MINTNGKNIVFLIDCSKSMYNELETITSKIMEFQKEGKVTIHIDYYIYGEKCMKLDRLEELKKSLYKIGSGSRTLSAIMYCIQNYKKGDRLVLITNSFPTDFISLFVVKQLLLNLQVFLFVINLSFEVPLSLHYLADKIVSYRKTIAIDLTKIL